MKPVFVLVCFAVLGVASLATAAEVKRVQFEPGKTSATLEGTVTDRATPVYVLRAGKGQKLTARVSGSTPNNDVVLTITSPSGKSLIGEEGADYDTHWSGVLKESGDFKITVAMIESTRSAYTLELSLR